MKAVVYTKYGPPDVLEIQEVKKPIPNDNEILVRVHASTVNRTDCGFLRAKPWIVRFFSGLTKPRNTILGNEFAGLVEAAGKDITKFKAGDKVFGFNDITFGAHAEYLTISENAMVTNMPSGMPYEEAAAITEGAHYALNNIRKANVQSGQKVLVNGATGGIGSAAVQLLKYYGTEVTGVCSTKYIELVRSLGADNVVDYTQEDFTKTDEQYDFIFDAVGKSSFPACKTILKEGGIYCSTEFGPFPHNPVLALWTPLFSSKKVIFPMPTTSQADAVFLKELVEQKKFKPVIDKQYPLEQTADAFRYLETGQKIGNVVITL